MSIIASLFWVVALMIAHFALELVRNSMLRTPMPVAHSLWEIKLDFGLVLFALVIVLYADVVFAALGIGQAARAAQAVKGAQMATRFGVIQRSLRVFFLVLDDFAKVALTVWQKVSGQKEQNQSQSLNDAEVSQQSAFLNDPAHKDEKTAPWKSLSKGDWATLVFCAVCFILVMFSPFWSMHGWDGVWSIFIEEMTP
ncbi:MAG: hypothetical protein ACK4VI_05645 [Alphaproteobacteria bacterium]